MNRIALGVLAACGLAGSFAAGVVAAEARDGGAATVAHVGQSLPLLKFRAPTTTEEKVANALAALPAALRKDARVVDYAADPGDPFPELRAGRNEWTCFPDYVPSKGDDPICFNRPGMQWLTAYYAGKPPQLTELAVIYRLRGGSDASLTDVFATEPAAGMDWVLYGPHMVVVTPEGATDTSHLTTTPGEHPWVMNRGTDYEHIHLPVG
ncbi:MAG: hypothetical protein ACT4QG_10155 [Sporichthyaceae bacterium]